MDAVTQVADHDRLVPTEKWVRARLGGHWVADSRRARLFYQGKVPRTYAMPAEDVQLDAVGDAARDVGDGLVALDWAAMGAWFEEDEEVLVHPRDPFVRVDVRRSSRHVVVEVDGETLAESRRPTLLFETGLPVRYYLPPVDVRLDLLSESDRVTGCPYKGYANYHHVDVGGRVRKDLIWVYPTPFADVAPIAGLMAFWNERVDVVVDGKKQGR